MKNRLFRSILIGFIGGIALYSVLNPQTIIAESNDLGLKFCMAPGVQYKVAKTMKMVVTAYTNIPELTDDTPDITASNKQIADGMVATNLFKFGTKIRIPEVFGDRILVVEDRMNHKYDGKPYLDVYRPTYNQARNFGAKITKVEVLEI